VELRGCYSNPKALEMVELAERAIDGIEIDAGRVPSPPPTRRWRLADRLGEQVIREMLQDRWSGMTKRAFAVRHGISLSSVKRILFSKEKTRRAGRGPSC